MLLAALVFALPSAQEPSTHEGLAFQFQHPAALTATENGNGGFYFTELRRSERNSDQADPSLRFILVPPSVQAFTPPQLMEGLLAEFSGRMTAKGWSADPLSDLARPMVGLSAQGKRQRWLKDGILQAEFDVYAFISSECNAV